MIGESYEYMNSTPSPTKGISQSFICQTPTNNSPGLLDLQPSGSKKSNNSGLKQKATREAPASTRVATTNNALSKKFNFEFGDISEEKS
tara:strand:- start:181 stop:447 length:267 start_codon:yes stop_codon:yes gene_type:complete